NRNDRRNRLRTAQLAHCDVRHADVADLALILKLLQRAHRLFDRHARIDTMQLLEVEPLDAQVAETLLGLTADRPRARVDRPLVRARPVVPGLGRDHEPLRVRRQCLANEALARLISCGRIDEVHTKLDRATQYALARLRIWRITPNTRSGDPHRPVP